MTTQRRKRVVFRPYAFEPLGVRLRLELDGIPVTTDEVNLTLAIDELQRWTQVSVRVLAEVMSSRCRWLLENGDAGLWVAARCGPTRWRNAIRLERSEDGWEAQFLLEHESLRDLVTFEPRVIVCRAIDAEVGVGQTIAEGRVWSLRIDPHRTHSAGYLQIRYRSFALATDIPATKDALYWLDFDSSEPVLWLNEDHTNASIVLQSHATRGAAARTRDVVFDSLTSAVWTQLFLAALDGYDGTEEPQYPWHRTVLESMGRRMYPDVAAAEVVAQLASEIDYVGLPHLLSRLDLVLQQRNELARHIERLVEETVL